MFWCRFALGRCLQVQNHKMEALNIYKESLEQLEDHYAAEKWKVDLCKDMIQGLEKPWSSYKFLAARLLLAIIFLMIEGEGVLTDIALAALWVVLLFVFVAACILLIKRSHATPAVGFKEYFGMRLREPHQAAVNGAYEGQSFTFWLLMTMLSYLLWYIYAACTDPTGFKEYNGSEIVQWGHWLIVMGWVAVEMIGVALQVDPLIMGQEPQEPRAADEHAWIIGAMPRQVSYLAESWTWTVVGAMPARILRIVSLHLHIHLMRQIRWWSESPWSFVPQLKQKLLPGQALAEQRAGMHRDGVVKSLI